jgi:predicted nucleotide-binding protein (sugar kinase/HSP70/actin superfamily)
MFPQSEEAVKGNGSHADITIALIGHPYLVYDDYISHQLVSRLQNMGVKVVTPEMVSADKLREAMSNIVERPYWTYEEDVIGAGAYYLQNGADGVISVDSFGCGPDSLMIELLQHHARKLSRPFINLVIDEHTADTGVITRLEAFIDLIRRGKEARPPRIYISREEKEPGGIGALGVPNLGNISAAMKEVGKLVGIKLIVPPITKQTLSLGTRHSPEFACLPFKVMLGTFIEALEQGADTLFMITSFNACRMGYYAKVQEQICRDLGYDFSMVKFKSSEKGLIGVLRAIKRLSNNA